MKNRFLLCAALGMLGALGALPVAAEEVGVVGLFPGKAVLVIDGGAPRTVRVGDKVGGVRLIAVDETSATVEVGGKRERLAIGQHAHAGGGGGGGGQSLSLTADSRGHFITTGTVNGATITFLVDTGATTIALGASDARRANINLANAEPVMMGTANGVVQAWRVKLASVRIGDVTLNEVEGTVSPHDMPYALLGMSFLNRMEMKRDGQTMTLRKRY
ncbi:MAG: TIGR02281 family clan AA aspartic protease [Zoogloeaceae bacterium]|jgi:aspartyl protease family protein|nr:TIGR02281 family clan AA aspartic protease [Zoogloeaceae bacterium]